MSNEDGKRGWIVVCACFISGFLYDGVCYSYGLIYIELLGAFKESKALTGGISSVMFSMGMLGPLAGMLVNRYGCRVTNVAAGIILALGYISSAFCTEIIYLYFSIGICVGLGLMALELTRDVIIVQYFDKRRSLARGLSISGSGFGVIVFNPLARWLIEEYGWRGTLLIEGGLALNLVACGLLMGPFSATMRVDNQAKLRTIDTQKEEDCSMPIRTDNAIITTEMQSHNVHEMQIHIDGTYIYQSRKENEDNFESLLNNSIDEKPIETTTNQLSDTVKLLDITLCTTPMFLAIFIAKCFLGFAYFAPFTFIPDMAVSSGWTRLQATWIMTAIGITNTASRILLAILMDIKYFNRVLAFAICLISVGALVAAMPLCKHYASLMAICIVFGLLTSGYCILDTLVLADLFGEKRVADTTGLCSFAFGVGSLIVGPITGAIFDASGSYIGGFIVIGASFVVAGALYIPLYKNPKKKGILTR